MEDLLESADLDLMGLETVGTFEPHQERGEDRIADSLNAAVPMPKQLAA